MLKLFKSYSDKPKLSGKKIFVKTLLTLFGVMLIFNINAQNDNDQILITIADEEITVGEFMNVFQKNNVKGEVIDKKSLEEYLDLYINFKLKVKEAEDIGLDTVSAFIEELSGYRKQLAEPYFINDEMNEQLLLESYERKKYDIRASHILIKIDAYALPEDTLVAYNKIIEIREKILGGESFEKLAKEASEDPSARDMEATEKRPFIRGNCGDLGYFTVFDMVYPFEDCAYKTEIGEISMPIRTDFGYHIIKVTDKKPAIGKAQIAHLYIMMPKDANAEDSLKTKAKIDSIYQKIQDGENFEELVIENSDDKGSANRGGVLPKFNVNRMVPEIIVAISSIDTGDISKPVLTSYGWHIVKLLEVSGIKPYNEAKNDLKKKLAKDKRSQKSKKAIISDIKNEYGFKENKKALQDFYKVIDSTIYEGKWELEKAKDLNDFLFSLDNKEYSQQDFAQYIVSNQYITKDEEIRVFTIKMYNNFVGKSCIDYEDTKLEEKHPDFKALMKEYRDGILLFELTDQKVWSKAVKDTLGLKNYYNDNKNNYMWGERLKASIFTFNEPEYTDIARKLIKEGKSDEEILFEINQDSLNILTIKHDKFSKNDNDIIDAIKWEKGISDNIDSNESVVFVVVHKKLKPEPKTLYEAKGIITADYQAYLEKDWIKSLKMKYPFIVNMEVFSTIK
ncbi:MAG: peptidylprolyl isomerase [Bacteroidales bacterium]|nr:peptidylprolyl isomerase [Bacteroidales bacterium]